ncbi:MAG: hypothetical protein ACI9OH_002672 [Oleispira sp.]
MGVAMFNTVLGRITQKLHGASLKNIYGNIIKLEWVAIAGLLTWLFVVFTTILN